MKTKVLIAIMMIAVLVFGSLTAAFADSGMQAEKGVKITREEAKNIGAEILKSKFGVDTSDKKYTYSMELRSDYYVIRKWTWQLNWNASDGRNNTFMGIVIDANSGELLSFNQSSRTIGQQNTSVTQLSKEQAKKIAEELLKKLNPEEFKQCVYNDTNGTIVSSTYRPAYYNFYYIRQVDGINFDTNSLRVSVDGVTGKINSYDYNWDKELIFPKKDKVIDAQKAVAVLNGSLEMTLNYQTMRSKMMTDKASGLKLIYSADSRKGNMVDALTGTVLGYDGKPMNERKTRNITHEQAVKTAEGKTVPKLQKELDSDSAAALMTQKVKEFFGDGYIVENINYSEREDYLGVQGRKTWSAEFRKNDAEFMGQYQGNITLDAQSGELMALDKYIWDEGNGEVFTPKITWEQGYDKAMELLGKYYPYRLGEIETEQICYDNSYIVSGVSIPERRIYFNFTRKFGNINYRQDGINIAFDAKTGELAEVYYNWDEGLKFPDEKTAIDIEAAKKILNENCKTELSYLLVSNSKDINKPSYEVKLVYELRNKTNPQFLGFVDAVSGKVLGNDGQEMAAPGNAFSDKIKGHWAEKELSILAFQGIIDAGSFEMNKEITKLEFIKMLVRAKGYNPYRSAVSGELKFTDVAKDTEDYGYVLEAIRLGFVDPKSDKFDGAKKLTREELAELLVKAMKYEKLAAAQDVFKLNFKDVKEISPDKYGAVAICKGLDVMSGDKDMFKPKANATMLEAAVALYKALTEITKVK